MPTVPTPTRRKRSDRMQLEDALVKRALRRHVHAKAMLRSTLEAPPLAAALAGLSAAAARLHDAVVCAAAAPLAQHATAAASDAAAHTVGAVHQVSGQFLLEDHMNATAPRPVRPGPCSQRKDVITKHHVNATAPRPVRPGAHAQRKDVINNHQFTHHMNATAPRPVRPGPCSQRKDMITKHQFTLHLITDSQLSPSIRARASAPDLQLRVSDRIPWLRERCPVAPRCTLVLAKLLLLHASVCQTTPAAR